MTTSSSVTVLAGALSALLSRTGRSVEEIATDLGVGAETVRAWLTGRRPMNGDNEFARLDTAAKLGEWLRARIVASGCTVREIADSTECVSMRTIYNWLRGEHLPPPPTGEERDRFDLLLANPRLNLDLRQRLQLDEIRRRLTGTSTRIVEPGPAWPARGLPSANRAFTGRGGELRRLDRLLSEHTRGRAVVISAVTGIGGVGKTALAVHWARSRDVRTTFTDGCLYLNLNGYADTPPLSPDSALTKLLPQLGVDAQDIPDDPDAKAARYHESLAKKKLLVILDNAYAEPQVRTLLPADPNCLTVITSRNRLHGLQATHTGITYLPLDTLTDAEAASLLRNLLGRLTTRTAADKQIDALAAACGHLPLAIHIAAANYLTHHHPRGASIGDYATTLAADRLAHLTIGPTDPATTIATALDHSYQHLTDTAQRAYRLLGLHTGPDFSLTAAASLTGMPITQAQSLLTELTQANLLTEHTAARYTFHDLIRDHAADLAHRTDSDKDRHAAIHRMLDHYLHTGYAAAQLLDPGRDPITLTPAHDGVIPEHLTDHGHAMSWFGSEHTVLLAAIDHAADAGFDSHVWQLTWTITNFLSVKGHWHEQTITGRLALAAAQRLNDRNAQAHAHRYIAYASVLLGRLDDAHTHLRHALELHRQVGDQAGQAAAHHGLSNVWERKGRHTEALDHSSQALELHRNRDDLHGQARALNAIGWFHTLLGHHTQALAYCQQALALYRELNYDKGMALTSDSLGYAHHHLGHHTQAIASYKQALALFQELHIYYEQASTLTRLGDTYYTIGDLHAARDAWQQALDIFIELDHADATEVRAKLAELD